MSNRTDVEESGVAGRRSEESAVETPKPTAPTPPMGDVNTSSTALYTSCTGSDPFTQPDKSEWPETPSFPDTEGVGSITTSASNPQSHSGGALTKPPASQQVEQELELERLDAAVQKATEEQMSLRKCISILNHYLKKPRFPTSGKENRCSA